MFGLVKSTDFKLNIAEKVSNKNEFLSKILHKHI